MVIIEIIIGETIMDNTISAKCESCKGEYKILNKQYDKFDVVKCSICGCLDRAIRVIIKRGKYEDT